MKKKLLSVALVAGLLSTLFSCTENSRVRRFGGTMTIDLPKGEKLLMVTWANANLFYLTEPMDSIYTPKTKTFKEKSKYGAMEATIIFRESK